VKKTGPSGCDLFCRIRVIDCVIFFTNMPRIASHDTIDRQQQLLRLLPKEPEGITARQLTEKLKDHGYVVTKRTVERDLNRLSSTFGLRSITVSGTQHWHLLNSSKPDLPGLSVGDALTTVLVNDMLGTLLPQTLLGSAKAQADKALERLNASRANVFTDWRKLVRYVPPTLPFKPPALRPDIIATVHKALTETLQLEIRYLAPADRSTKSLTLHPLAFIQQGVVAYLVATAFEYEDIRLYALHRVQRARALTTPTRRSKTFDLDAYLASGGMEFGEGGHIRLEAIVEPQLAYVLQESVLAADQTLTHRPDKDYLLRATVKDSWLLHRWILSQGDAIKVLRPASLRDSIAKSLSSAFSAYTPRQKGQR